MYDYLMTLPLGTLTVFYVVGSLGMIMSFEHISKEGRVALYLLISAVFYAFTLPLVGYALGFDVFSIMIGLVASFAVGFFASRLVQLVLIAYGVCSYKDIHPESTWDEEE